MLTLKELLIETDPDLPIVATMTVGFDDNGCLVLEYEIINYDIPSESRKKRAVVEKQEAYALANKLNISLILLPSYIFKRFSIQPFCQTVPSEAHALYKDILEFFVSYGVKYHLKGIL